MSRDTNSGGSSTSRRSFLGTAAALGILESTELGESGVFTGLNDHRDDEDEEDEGEEADEEKEEEPPWAPRGHDHSGQNGSTDRLGVASPVRSIDVELLNTTVYARPGDDLQAKVDAAEGGMLVLTAGTHTLPPAGLEIGSHTSIVGAGMGSTILERHPDDSGYIHVRNKNTPTGDTDIVLADLTIETNYATGDTGRPGGALSLSAENVLLSGVRIANGKRHCLELCQTVGFLAIRCDFDTAYGDDVVQIVDSDEGFAGATGASVSDDVVFFDCDMHGAVGIHTPGAKKWSHGFEFEEGPKHAVLRECRLYDNVGGDIKAKHESDEVQPGTLELHGCDLLSELSAGDSPSVGAKELVLVNCTVPDATVRAPEECLFRDCLVEGIRADGAGTIEGCTITSSLDVRGDVVVSSCRFTPGARLDAPGGRPNVHDNTFDRDTVVRIEGPGGTRPTEYTFRDNAAVNKLIVDARIGRVIGNEFRPVGHSDPAMNVIKNSSLENTVVGDNSFRGYDASGPLLRIAPGKFRSRGCVFRNNGFMDVSGGEYAIEIGAAGDIDQFLFAGNYWDRTGAGFLLDDTPGEESVERQIRLANNLVEYGRNPLTRNEIDVSQIDVVLNGMAQSSLGGSSPDARDFGVGDSVLDTDTDSVHFVYDNTDPNGSIELGA